MLLRGGYMRRSPLLQRRQLGGELLGRRIAHLEDANDRAGLARDDPALRRVSKVLERQLGGAPVDAPVDENLRHLAD